MRPSRNRALRNLVQKRLQLGLLISITVLGLAGLLYSVYGLGSSSVLRVGEASPRDFRARTTMPIPDRILTEREKQLARAQIAPIFKADPELRQLVTSEISAANLPAEVQDILIVAYSSSEGITELQRDALIEQAVTISPMERKREVRLLLERRLISTAVPDVERTEALRDTAANTVTPILQTLEAGQLIVAEGEILTEEHLSILRKAELYNARADQTSNVMRHILSSLILALFLNLPLIFIIPRLSFGQLSFVVLLTLIALVAQRFALLFDPSFLFVSMVSLLISVIISPLAGILWSVWLAICMGLVTQAAPLGLLIATLTAGITASLLAATFKARVNLLIAGLLSGFSAAIIYLALLFLYGGANTLTALTSSTLFIAGGAVAGILALGILPLAESAFDFTTDFRLNELSSPTNPLLQRLLLEAPGTYQHSLIISNLVEQAVSNIGGNALLARVASLYHDVGKLRRPHFFIENQFSVKNPHNSISPHLSYLIITSHTRDGVDLLKENKLPKSFYAFATEHHGTTVLSYFYKKALEESENLDEFNFRYQGPKPSSKETAVLMLADAVESASRSLQDPTPGNIRGLIDQIFEMRLQDGQLSESPLNLRDIEVIANTFERMMTAILHRRIRYPSIEEIEKLEQGERGTRGRSSRRNKTVAVS